MLDEFGDSIESIRHISSILSGFQNITSKIISLTPTNKTNTFSNQTNGRHISFEYEVETPIESGSSGTTTGEHGDDDIAAAEEDVDRKDHREAKEIIAESSNQFNHENETNGDNEDEEVVHD